MAHARKHYLRVFFALVILTVAEISVVYVPSVPRGPLISALVLLAIAKAALVLLFFMHLAKEKRALQLTVIVPFMLPAVYAMALIGEAAWRLLP